MRLVARRCIAGEFGGSAIKAAAEPECVRLGVFESVIRYHMDKIVPIAAAARAAERARMAAEAAHVPVKIVFVEWGGSAPAAAAVDAAIGVIESQIGVQVGRVAKRAREEASTTLQAELEVEAERREALETELDKLLLSNAAQRRKVEAGERQVAALQAQLARTSSNAAASATKAEATVEAAKGGAAAARKKAKVAGQSLARTTPEQINELIRKPQFNTHHTIPYPPTPTHPHTLYTHTFRRAVRAAVLQTLRVAHGPSLAVVVVGEAGHWGRPG